MAVVATGFFDGVHSGHLQVISTLLGTARKRGEKSQIVTFWPHPRAVLQNDARNLTLLTTNSEREVLLRSLGVDEVQTLGFDKDFAAKSAEDFLLELKAQGADAIVLGYDNRIGSDGLTTAQIASLCERVGLGVEVCSPFMYRDEAVSSTRIRKALAEGEIKEANEMLSRPYSLSGVVVPGFQRGRTIGFPTANLKLREPLKAVPGVGAYYGRAILGDDTFKTMVNIDRQGRIEAHILDFSRDIYGLDLTVEFLGKIRDELQFDSLESLKVQLEKDLKFCIFVE